MAQQAWKKLVPYSLLAATAAMIGIFGYRVAWPWAFERWRLRPAIANLTDERGDFQKDAVLQLRQMGPEIAPRVARMMEYEEESENFHKNVARAIAMLLDPIADAEQMNRVVPVLARVFEDTSKPLEMRRSAGWALASMALDGLDSSAAIHADELLNDADEHIRLWARMLTAERGPDAESHDAALHRFLASNNADERYVAALAIRAIDHRHTELAVETHCGTMQSGVWGTGVQSASARTLGEIGPDAADAVTALIGAIRAVSRLSDHERVEHSVLLQDGRMLVSAACYALERIGPAAKDAIPTLIELATDPNTDESVRNSTAATLKKLAPHVAQILEE